MSTLINGTVLSDEIILNKQTSTLTLDTDNKYVDKDIQFYLTVQSGAAGAGSIEADVDVQSGGTNNISSVIGTKSTTQPSGYYIKLEASGSGSPTISTAGWIDAGSMAPATTTAVKYFPIAAASVTQNTPTIDEATGLVSATATTSAGYTPALTTAASTLQLSTQSGKTVTPTESQQTAVAAGKYTTGNVLVGAISPSYVGSAIPKNSTSSLIIEGDTVTAPAGYYAENAAGSVSAGSVKSGSANISSVSVAYDSKNDDFDITGTGNVSAPSVITAGYISSSKGTKAANNDGASVNASVSKIAGATNITGTFTYKPSISKQSTPSGVVNAASGNATTTAPSSGVYVAVKATGGTNQITATPSISTAGYGEASHHGITNGTANVGADDSSVTYVPITTTSASVSGKTVTYGTGWITGATKSVADGTTDYAVSSLPSGATSSGTINRGKYIKIGQGWHEDEYYLAQSNSGDKTISSAGTTNVDGYATATVAAGTVKATVSSNTAGSASMSATGITPLESGTSDYYVTLSTSPGKVKAKAAGDTAGYVTSSTTNETALTNVSVSGNGTKMYLPTTGVTASVSSNTSGSASMSATGFTPLSSGTSGYYVTLSTTAGSVKAKAVGNGTGIVTSSTSNETAATSVSVTGNGNKLYIPASSVTEEVTTVSGTTADRGEWSLSAGYTAARTIGAATFANTATADTTYVDISSTTDAPVLVSGGHLYINKGYTDNLKISLAKLVPDGASANLASGVILSGYSAYNNDGTLVAGNIPTKTGSNLSASGKTVTVPAGYYAQQYTKNVADGAYSADSSASSNSTVTPSLGLDSTATTTYGFTTTAPSSGTSGTNFLTLDPGASATAWSVTPRANITASGYIAQESKNGTAVSQTPSIVAGTNYYVPVVSASFSGGGITITNNYSKSDLAVTMADGSDKNVSNYTVGAKDTTNYPYYVKVSGSTPAVSGKTKATRAAATYTNSAGVIAAHSGTQIWAANAVEPTVSVNAASGATYVGFKSAAISGSSTNATATTTVAPGTVSVSKQATPSGVTNAASGNATTTAPSSGVYVAVKATAAANSTGTTSTISGSGTATVTEAGYAPTTLTGTVSVGGTATAKTSAKDSSMTYVPITTATPAFDGGGLSGTATASSSQATLSDSTNTSGIAITTACTATRADVLYNGAVAGWVSKADNAVALSSGSSAMTAKTYYVNAVTVPSSKTFTVTNNGTATVFSGSATAGNLTVSAYNSSGTAENNKSIVSAGKWVATSVSAAGTYYGRVTVGTGAVSASVSSNTGGSASMAATGFTASSSATSYYVTLSTIAGSVKAKAQGSTAGYITTSTSNETAATSVAVSGNGNKLYIPTTGVTASVSSNTAGSASMAATGFTASSSATSYYVTLSTSAGSVKAKAVGNGTGIITSSTSNETAATSVSVSGNGNKVYIPVASPTFSAAPTGGSTASSSTASISNSTNNSGVSIQTAYSINAAAINYSAAVKGMLDKSANTSTGSNTTAKGSTNGALYYINGVTMATPSSGSRTFTVTAPSGGTNHTYTFTQGANGRTTIKVDNTLTMTWNATDESLDFIYT